MRRYPRYRASIPCVLEAEDGTTFNAVIIDLSIGGAGIEVGGDAGRITQFELLVLDGRSQFRLPCQARQVRDAWNRRVVHAEFLRPEPYAATQLKDLLERLQAEPDYGYPAHEGPWLRRILRKLVS